MTANHIAHKVDAAAVELRLDRISRLYNSLDPSPFQEKELDAAADDYIVGSAEDLGSRPMRLVIFLPEEELARSESAHVATSIRHHFELRRRSEWRQLRTMWWRARTSLAVGVIFLVVCLVARHFLAGSPSPIAHIFSEGLLIVGWVAMWGPLDISFTAGGRSTRATSCWSGYLISRSSFAPSNELRAVHQHQADHDHRCRGDPPSAEWLAQQ